MAYREDVEAVKAVDRRARMLRRGEERTEFFEEIGDPGPTAPPDLPRAIDVIEMIQKLQEETLEEIDRLANRITGIMTPQSDMQAADFKLAAAGGDHSPIVSALFAIVARQRSITANIFELRNRVQL